MHGFPHVCNAVSPASASRVNGSHTALKLMANVALAENQVFPSCRREELSRLILGNLIPADHALLQRKVERGDLVGSESTGLRGSARKPNGLDLDAVIPGPDRVSNSGPGVRQHDDIDLVSRSAPPQMRLENGAPPTPFTVPVIVAP